MKRLIINVLCAVLFLSILIMIVIGVHNIKNDESSYEDGIDSIDLNTIYLNQSGVEVRFSNVILSSHNETRKLIVDEQEATISTLLTDRIIKQLDFDFLKKTQTVKYTGKGCFVVDLDKLTENSISVDKASNIITIKIPHSHFEEIRIDPNMIIIDEVKEGLLARGDIELTLMDYNIIEKELKTRLEEKLDTVENGQKADDIAREMVREVYEPAIKAIDGRYNVIVEFE